MGRNEDAFWEATAWGGCLSSPFQSVNLKSCLDCKLDRHLPLRGHCLLFLLSPSKYLVATWWPCWNKERREASDSSPARVLGCLSVLAARRNPPTDRPTSETRPSTAPSSAQVTQNPQLHTETPPCSRSWLSTKLPA